MPVRDVGRRPPPKIPRGPRALTFPERRDEGWIVEPPEWFPGGNLVRAQVSKDEWWMWQAYALTHKDPPRPWGPEDAQGGIWWQYQVDDPAFGGREIRGGQVIDFVLYSPRGKFAVRIQSDLHIFNPFGGPTVARDLFFASHLQGYEKVIDLFSQHYMHDESGQAACQLARESMRGHQRPSPITTGTARRAGT